MHDSIRKCIPDRLVTGVRILQARTREATGAWRVLPRIMIIGAMRAGTSSLYSYLIQHASVGPSLRKEVHYFDVNYPRGLSWYRSHFPLGVGGQLGIDASPYYMQHPLVLQRVLKLLPDLKVIVLLRNPVDRAFSHYQKNLRDGKDVLPFREALEREESRIQGEFEKLIREPTYNSFSYRQLTYRGKGIYAPQIRPWLEAFAPSNVLVLKSEDLFEDPATIHRQVLDYLELPFVPLKSYPTMNAFPQVSDIDVVTRSELLEFYRPHNKELYELVGRDFGWS